MPVLLAAIAVLNIQAAKVDAPMLMGRKLGEVQKTLGPGTRVSKTRIARYDARVIEWHAVNDDEGRPTGTYELSINWPRAELDPEFGRGYRAPLKLTSWLDLLGSPLSEWERRYGRLTLAGEGIFLGKRPGFESVTVRTPSDRDARISEVSLVVRGKTLEAVAESVGINLEGWERAEGVFANIDVRYRRPATPKYEEWYSFKDGLSVRFRAGVAREVRLNVPISTTVESAARLLALEYGPQHGLLPRQADYTPYYRLRLLPKSNHLVASYSFAIDIPE